jgi:hypothetical protein
MSETTVESLVWSVAASGVSGSSGISPTNTMPPMAARPADGSRAVLPAASPAAEIPGLTLDTGQPRGSLLFRPQFAQRRPLVVFRRAHPLHVPKPPVRVVQKYFGLASV